MTESVVLFILVYFAAASAKLPDPQGLTGSKIEMVPNNMVQYLNFDDLSYNLTDFTICTWLKLLNFSHTQTIFRLTGDKRETVLLWRMHARPKEVTRVTIKNRLVASEGTRLAGGQWNHVCFQWKGLTGVWAMFVNSKIHSVGQVPTGNETISPTAASWKLHGKGAGMIGDDTVPCRNGWQAYGLYMAGSSEAAAAVNVSTTTTTKPSTNGTVTGKRSSAKGKGVKSKSNKRQAVFESPEPEDPSATPPKPFQWVTKTFAFVKRMFTFVIIPFFKFVRNTFFQTRSMDDTVVDVSETHLTVSDIKYTPPPSLSLSTTTTTSTATTSLDDSGDVDVVDVKRQSSSSVKRETDGGSGGDERCSVNDDRVTAVDLVGPMAPAGDDSNLMPNAGNYLRMVSDGLNDVGVSVAFVRRAFACCRRPLLPLDHRTAVVIDWDGALARVHNITVSTQACGRRTL